MDFIKRKANDFMDEHFLGGIESVDKITSEARFILSDIDAPIDKIKFLNLILEKNNLDYSEHLKVCKNKEDCSLNYNYEGIAYYLSQELARLGVQINDDVFTKDEKLQAETKIDQILKDLDEMKLGQQILFEELNEMRDLFFLGKKKMVSIDYRKRV